MSGTSLDGMDAALIETDGRDFVRPLAFLSQPYDSGFRKKLRACLGNRKGLRDSAVENTAKELTKLHADLVQKLLKKEKLKPAEIDLVGFHGQTIWHAPHERQTCQIGDGAQLAKLTGIPVISDFRRADVEAGGHGAPFVPLYHQARAADLEKPLAVLNIGGVANLTWLDARGNVLAFDTGPGNAMIDDWMAQHEGKPHDEGGKIAARGQIDWQLIHKFVRHSYFTAVAPKSLDRDAFKNFPVDHLKGADAVATLTMMCVASVGAALALIDSMPMRVLVTGGGRHNATIMKWLHGLLAIPVQPVEAVKWNGDALEAEAFAYLAVRSKLGLPLSLPSTTGVHRPMSGGILHAA